MNESYWQKTSQHPCFKQLNKDIKTDILIIGGGLSGISCAYQLKETGKQINYCWKESFNLPWQRVLLKIYIFARKALIYKRREYEP